MLQINKRYEFLLGATFDNEIVTGEFEVTTRNGYKEFSASFNSSEIVDETNFDKSRYVEDMLDGYPKEELFNMCERNDCKPSELVDIIADEESTMELLDCSLYPVEVEVNNINYIFRASGCGQHDTREEMQSYTNQEAYDLLHEIWDKYHLSKVDDDVIEKLEKVIELLNGFERYGSEEEEWIKNYIMEVM